MVSLLLDSTRLEIALSAIERALSFRTGDLTVERAQINRVQLTGDAWNWLRGHAHPGTHIPKTVAMGTWQSATGNDFALVRRNRPGAVIDLAGHPEFERIVLTTRNGLALARALRRRVEPGTGLVDVEAVNAGAIDAVPEQSAS